jgi:hypothetical protein
MFGGIFVAMAITCLVTAHPYSYLTFATLWLGGGGAKFLFLLIDRPPIAAGLRSASFDVLVGLALISGFYSQWSAGDPKAPGMLPGYATWFDQAKIPFEQRARSFSRPPEYWGVQNVSSDHDSESNPTADSELRFALPEAVDTNAVSLRTGSVWFASARLPRECSRMTKRRENSW